jgi:hypothetical protein
MTTSLTALHDTIARLVREGGGNNFVVISPRGNDRVYVQLMSGLGSNEIYAEAVSNWYLPPGEELSNEQIDTLERLGWEEPETEGNYSYTWRLSTEDVVWNVAEHALQTLREVFGVADALDLEVTLSLEG